MKESSIKRGKEDLRGDKLSGNIKSGTRKERSSKGVGGVKDKKTTGRFSKMKEIIIVRKNSDIVEGEKTDGKPTEEILDGIEKIGITGEEGEVDGSEKYLEQTTSDEDDKDSVGGVGSRGKKIIVRNKKNGLKYREKRKPLFKPDKKFKILEPGDQPCDCDSICSDFIAGNVLFIIYLFYVLHLRYRFYYHRALSRNYFIDVNYTFIATYFFFFIDFRPLVEPSFIHDNHF